MMKRILIGIIFFCLCLPAILSLCGYGRGQLEGYIEKAECPVMHKASIWSGTWQRDEEQYLKQRLAFSSKFIRLANQMRYSFFSTSKADVFVGKDSYLYQYGYVYNHNGENTSDKNTIVNNVTCLSHLRDSLQAHNTDLVVLIAPGKADFYPEYLPSRYQKKIKPTNYDLYSQYLYKANINYLDFNKWICSLKGKTKYPLYPKTGVHWNQYACLLAQDSIVRYFEAKYNRLLPHIIAKNITMSKVMNGKDDDLEKILNLIFPIPDNPMPHITFAPQSSTAQREKIKVLVIGDSYYHGLRDTGLEKWVFGDSEYWYYFDAVSKDGKDIGHVMDMYNVKEKMNTFDVVLMVMTQGTLQFTPDKFFKEVYQEYVFSNDKHLYDRLVSFYIRQINSDKNWLKDVQLKADEKHISLKEAVKEDAIWMAKEKIKERMKTNQQK
jgi:hypothetical protein